MKEAAVPAAAYMSHEELHALSEHAVVRSFPRNAVIVSEGDDTDSLYIIIEGRVKVFLADEDGREVLLTTQGPGDFFGEMVLDGGPRSASVMTLEPSRFAVIPTQRFRDFLHSHPRFSIHLIEKLIRRSRVLTENVKSLALMDVYGRVARLLLDLAVEEDGRRVVRERLTQQDVASRVGASREMVGRILKDLVTGGYISIDKQWITLHRNPPKHW